MIKEKQANLLFVLMKRNKGMSVSDISRETRTTYVHTSNLLKEYEALGLIKAEKHGKTKFIVITEKGFKIAQLLDEVKNLVYKQQDTDQSNEIQQQ